jgi:PhnB protein
MQLTPYLNFDGQCAAAFKFYEQLFGGKILFLQTFGESPAKDQTPAEWQGKVMHATLAIGNQQLMGSDAAPPHFEKAQGITIAINLASTTDGERIFAALAEGGVVKMPFEKTFWSPGFGMVVDRFGTPWMVNCETAGV